ncbi:MAG: hypothetical protein H6828_14250 [Planctomycetes bacterium]|nr:hypothetical protein [Planctomycetota bacterium]
MLRTVVTTLLGLALLVPAARGGDEGRRQSTFSWAQTSQDLGTVAVPATGGTSPWYQGPLGTRYRSVPSYTGDPTFEVVIRAPQSGSPTLAERLLIQIPAGFYAQPWSNRAAVFGFHSFGVSEKDVFLNSSLAWECSARQWLLVAPYGLTDTNYACPQTQDSLEAMGHVLYSLIPFNYRRVYAVGFSMGGLSALSYATRHLDPWQLQFAGVVVHTAPLDMRREVQVKPFIASILLANAAHFGATYATAPFEYERVSPVRFLTSGLVDDQAAPVVNLEGRPIFLHANLADPDPLLVSGMTELGSFLSARGAWVYPSLVHDPAAGHAWSTLPMAQALDFVAQSWLPAVGPPKVEVFADRPGRWPHAEVLAQPPDTFARYTLELSPVAASTPNSVALTATRELDQVLLDLGRLNLSKLAPLEVRHQSADGSPDTLILAGYAGPPSAVTVDGGAPVSVQWQDVYQELWIQPTSDGHACTLVVTP